MRAKVSELLVQVSAYKVSVSEKAYADSSLASAGVGLTVMPSGKVTGGTVDDTGTVTIVGSSTSIGTNVTIMLVPAIAVNRILWTCHVGNLTQYKFVPSECRH
ncbi:MAG: pilin [Betaproteobacteria bacterium]|nr:pilin [Betaproteobacteria bacterium]